MTLSSGSDKCADVRSPTKSMAQATLGMINTLLVWQARHRMRRDLSWLDPHLLADIGVQPHAAAAECRKPCWRA